MKLQSEYTWLTQIPVLPKMVAEGLKLLTQDTKEIVGEKDNPVIMQLVKEAGVTDIYTHDDTMPWCAVAHTAIALRAGKDVSFKSYDRLRAKSYGNWGLAQTVPMLGDTLVFIRPEGHHVGMYIAEDATAFHVMGGNQGNQYSITRIGKDRLSAVRRPVYKTGQPDSVKAVAVSATGVVSSNEA
jgi:uncharacterized protein (TIGR02594 family)